jgi:hypothetical protein
VSVLHITNGDGAADARRDRRAGLAAADEAILNAAERDEVVLWWHGGVHLHAEVGSQWRWDSAGQTLVSWDKSGNR